MAAVEADSANNYHWKDKNWTVIGEMKMAIIGIRSKDQAKA